MGSWAFCSQLLINNATSIPCFALHLCALTRNISKSLKRKSHASMDLFIFYNPLINNATSIPCFALHLSAPTRNISKSLKRKSHASMDLFIFYNPLINNATSIPCFALHLSALTRNICEKLNRKSHASMDFRFIFSHALFIYHARWFFLLKDRMVTFQLLLCHQEES